MPLLSLYIRHGCHLCEDMEQHLLGLKDELCFSWKVFDVDADKALYLKYNEMVPVLMGGEEEICHYFLDEVALRHYLNSPTTR